MSGKGHNSGKLQAYADRMRPLIREWLDTGDALREIAREMREDGLSAADLKAIIKAEEMGDRDNSTKQIDRISQQIQERRIYLDALGHDDDQTKQNVSGAAQEGRTRARGESAAGQRKISKASVAPENRQETKNDNSEEAPREPVRPAAAAPSPVPTTPPADTQPADGAAPNSGSAGEQVAATGTPGAAPAAGANGHPNGLRLRGDDDLLDIPAFLRRDQVSAVAPAVPDAPPRAAAPVAVDPF